MSNDPGWLKKEAVRAQERSESVPPHARPTYGTTTSSSSDWGVFTAESLAAHDAVVENNLRLHLAKELKALMTNDDLLGALLRMDTPMAEGARMALDVAADVVAPDRTKVPSDGIEPPLPEG